MQPQVPGNRTTFQYWIPSQDQSLPVSGTRSTQGAGANLVCTMESSAEFFKSTNLQAAPQSLMFITELRHALGGLFAPAEASPLFTSLRLQAAELCGGSQQAPLSSSSFRLSSANGKRLHAWAGWEEREVRAFTPCSVHARLCFTSYCVLLF